MDSRKSRCLGSLSMLLAGLAFAGEPIPNWSAPPTWSPLRPAGITTLAETNPLPFIAVTPCRIADTRGLGFSAQAGPPSLSGMVTRVFQITGTVAGVPAQCGIPLSALAVSFQFTIIQPSADGNLIAWPGGTAPTVSVLNWPPGVFALGNGIVVPVSASGALSVRINGSVGSTGNLTIDVNGYYPQTSATNRLASGEFFGVYGTRPGDAVLVGENDSGTAGSSGIRGAATGGGVTYGVSGTAGLASDAAGVRGVAGSGLPVPAPPFFETAGVRGEGGSAASGFGVLGISPRFGVSGYLLSPAPDVLTEGHLGYGFEGKYGVSGYSYVATNQSAGVFGVDSTNSPPGNGSASSGVRGESNFGIGTYGRSKSKAVVGDLVNDSGETLTFGGLGIALGTALDMTTGPWGVFTSGKIGAMGTKHFVEPHPSDPTKVILYASLEGREAGTYFRGTSRTANGRVAVEVPEDFRIVTDEEGLTVQLTSIGGPPTMYVESQDLNRIVVRSVRDVSFHYLVQGVRRAFRDFEPIARGGEFVPRSSEERMPAYLTEEAKRRLIANGTYNADGSVNMQTAERVGWTRMWRETEERDRAAAEASRLRAAAGMPRQ